jgi:hypothetical protein
MDDGYMYMGWRPDVLYGALGFPVVGVTVTGVRLALATAAWLNRRFGLLRQHTIRVGAIAIATAGLALFNVELDQPALASLGTAAISN